MSVNCDPNALMEAARCFDKCIPIGMQQEVITYLLCQIAQGGGGGAGAGILTFAATGMTSFSINADDADTELHFPNLLTPGSFSADNMINLTVLDMPVVQSMNSMDVSDNHLIQSYSFPVLTTMGGTLDFDNCAILTSFSAPLLGAVGGDLIISMCPMLTTIDLGSVVNVLGSIVANSSGSLVSFSLPLLVTVLADVNFSSSPALTNLNFPVWVPSNGTTIELSNCNLNHTSIEQVLRRCVLAGVTTCTIKMQGGTNAGLASLSAQGQADAATLGAQLTINP